LVRAVGRGRFPRGAQCNSKSQKCMYIVEYTFTAGVPTILSGLFCPFFSSSSSLWPPCKRNNVCCIFLPSPFVALVLCVSFRNKKILEEITCFFFRLGVERGYGTPAVNRGGVPAALILSIHQQNACVA
jgi:hypothetical protein